MSMMRSLRASIVLTVLICGCGSQPHDYTYQGVLLRPDGSPAAGVPVIVAPASAIFRPIPKEATQTTTDAGGRFTGGFPNDMDGDGWTRLPLSAVPPLPGVWLWVLQDSAWRPIAVSLDAMQQHQDCLGRQKIPMPPVVVAENSASTTRPSSAPTTATAPTNAMH